MRILNFFSRRSGKTHDAARGAESWQAGDWAECVILGQWRSRPGDEPFAGPRHGQVMKVTGVRIWRDPAVPGRRVLTLAFAGWADSWFEAAQFRKLNPRADEATAAEAEFTALVKRKPRPALAPKLPGEKIEEFQ